MKEFNYLIERRRMLDSLGRKFGVCNGIACENCNFYIGYQCKMNASFEVEHPEEATKIVRDWAEAHPIPKVDWTKVPVDTKILVGYSDNDLQLVRRHFAKFQYGKVYAYDNGCTSFTADGDSPWKYAKLAKE